MIAKRVTVVDYGVGNLLSVRRALEHCGAQVETSDRAESISKAERLVLPGVGAFGNCMKELGTRDLIGPVRDFADSGRPFLGICVGMQILLDEGEEFDRCTGLGLIPGRVEAIPNTSIDATPHKIPHIGWTPIYPPVGGSESHWRGSILDKVTPGAVVYFVHSYTAVPNDPAHRLADCYYNGRLVSGSIRRDNITGTQFHPEKSGAIGLSILRRFLSQ